MVMSPFICGSANFLEEDKEEKPWSSLPSTPRKTSSPKHSFCKKNSFCNKNSSNNNNIRDSKNPYSTRGLDKFSALLAELEEKRQRIYSQVDSKDVSFVRFVYSNENDCIPIVVKLKENQTETEKEKKKPNKNREAKHDLEIPDHKSQAEPIVTAAVEEVNKPSKLEPKEVEKRRLKWSSSVLRLQKWRRPSYYLPVAILLILLFLALFGRSFAILCTSLGWYIVPTLTSSDSKRPAKNNKKVYVRRFSENKMAIDGLSSPKKNNPGAVKDKSPPRKHGHQKSW
ncbi:uncharacterized protein LOC120009695 [Tripterygium wilfordii]|uniref:uncharacterized protein LOC120009695 n=1 Tax=Tripterygium wilfordii TaxID=458696 RepID=UPI0018F86252|nr:uncharacterized protein LOC120009695 [Tripterygium wilfordii]